MLLTVQLEVHSLLCTSAACCGPKAHARPGLPQPSKLRRTSVKLPQPTTGRGQLHMKYEQTSQIDFPPFCALHNSVSVLSLLMCQLQSRADETPS
ncbi:hypothetical protein BD289DRAFT_434336 [Coniella lustricola]|uniref:Uncharacterized protein n=1 Tax=Coniella lustricola TaxID=2025994 RepID=A0A2T3A7H5_9PEZI|nr:hypothetical protein BD289DRAFT_434336 [Coniella lustricola]